MRLPTFYEQNLIPNWGIDFGLRGNCQGSVVDGSGKNCLWTTDTEESFRSQEELYKYYKSHITND